MPASKERQNGAEPPANASDGDEAMSPGPTIRYSCENGRAVLARYGDPEAGDSTVDLDIAGTRRQLTQAISATGVRYETSQGLSAGKKLAWWTKGAGAMLIESDAQDNDGAADKIVNCTQIAETE